MLLAETTGTETIYGQTQPKTIWLGLAWHGLDLVAQNDGVSTGYFAYDGLGSVRQMLDGAGNVLFAQAFNPYGNPYTSPGISSTSWGYSGAQVDDSSRLIYSRAHRYSPQTGRFTSRDLWYSDYPKRRVGFSCQYRSRAALSSHRFGELLGSPWWLI